MTTEGADVAVRDELLRAFAELRPQMIAYARRDADLDPSSRIGQFSDGDLEQFINAWEALFTEALEGSGRQTRELIFETALPPIVDMGQTSLDMIRSNVISAVMLAHRLLPRVAEQHREEAARWLARFQSEYAHDLLQRVRELEGGTP